MRGLSFSCRQTPSPFPLFSSSKSDPNPRSPRSVSVSTANPQVSGAGSPVPRRRLILLRHADSASPGRFIRGNPRLVKLYSPVIARNVGESRVSDHDRPLSKLGRADAVAVAKKLRQLGWIPELILSSDAVRTKETLHIMQEHAHEFSEAKVYFVPSFYSVAAMDGQTADHLQKTICEYSVDEILTIMCMGHNRGWEEAASMFSGSPIELKTCNAALLEASGKSWNEAFAVAGLGGWKLHGVVKPDTSL